jgi:hypothetical protein
VVANPARNAIPPASASFQILVRLTFITFTLEYLDLNHKLRGHP